MSDVDADGGAVRLLDGVDVRDAEAVPVRLLVGVPVREGVCVPVGVLVATPVRDDDGVSEDDGVIVRLADGETVSDGELHCDAFTYAPPVALYNRLTSVCVRARENMPISPNAPVKYATMLSPQQHQGWKPTKSGVLEYVPALCGRPPMPTTAPSRYATATVPSYVKAY